MVIPSLADILNASPLIPSKRWERGDPKHSVSYCFGYDSQRVPATFCARVVLGRAGGEEVYIAVAPVRCIESERFRTGEKHEDGSPITERRDVSHYVTLVTVAAGLNSSAKAFKGKSYKCYNDLAFIGEKVKEAYNEYVSFQQSITLE